MHYAIEEQLRAPVEEFRDVIRDHFRCGWLSIRP